MAETQKEKRSPGGGLTRKGAKKEQALSLVGIIQYDCQREENLDSSSHLPHVGKVKPRRRKWLALDLTARGWKSQDHLITGPPLHHLHNSIFQERHAYPKQWGLSDRLTDLWQAYFQIFKRVAYVASTFSSCQKLALPKQLK